MTLPQTTNFGTKFACSRGLLSDLSKFARDLFEVPIRLLGQIQGSLHIAGLLTAEVAKSSQIPRQLVVSLSPRPKLFMCRFQSVDFFGSFGGLLDQGASPPKMKKRGAKALKVLAEYQAAKRAAITSRQLPSFGVKELTAFVRAIERRFSQIRRERVAQKQRWRADRECPKAVPELVRLSASCPPLEHLQPQ